MKSPDLAQQRVRSLNALERVLDWITPWLVEVGSWALGGLIALNLVVIAALITVGPVDRAVEIGVAAFACALPFDVAGIVLLRLIKDARDSRFDDLTLKAFQEAQFPDFEAYLPPANERESFARRRARIALAYALVISTLSIALTLAGLVASLWHLAPWVAGAFVATVAFSGLALVAVVVHSLPPQSEAERQLRRRHSTRRPQKEPR
jgi:hypothetical protein